MFKMRHRIAIDICKCFAILMEKFLNEFLQNPDLSLRLSELRKNQKYVLELDR